MSASADYTMYRMLRLVACVTRLLRRYLGPDGRNAAAEANLQWSNARFPEDTQLTLKGNIASVLLDLNRVEEAIAQMRANLAESQRIVGP